MDKKNQINDIMESAIEKIKSIVDVNTVVGVPFETKEGTLIIPLTKVSVGFVTGGGEYGINGKEPKCDNLPLAGGSGGGVSMSPIGLLTIKDDDCKLIRVDQKTPYDKLMDTIPTIVSNITSIINKEPQNDNKKK